MIDESIIQAYEKVLKTTLSHARMYKTHWQILFDYYNENHEKKLSIRLYAMLCQGDEIHSGTNPRPCQPLIPYTPTALYFPGHANAAGFIPKKFVRNPYTVDWRKKRYKARILEGRQPITEWFSTDQLETKLNEIKVNTESV